MLLLPTATASTVHRQQHCELGHGNGHQPRHGVKLPVCCGSLKKLYQGVNGDERTNVQEAEDKYHEPLQGATQGEVALCEPYQEGGTNKRGGRKDQEPCGIHGHGQRLGVKKRCHRQVVHDVRHHGHKDHEEVAQGNSPASERLRHSDGDLRPYELVECDQGVLVGCLGRNCLRLPHVPGYVAVHHAAIRLLQAMRITVMERAHVLTHLLLLLGPPTKGPGDHQQ
mmetsp:Transcript_132556/g.314234  ORF Transcript_132556/g.314234 Transcript_132556/m.314234 type:complete len:225 (-) Transcript_132556:526-1200(-)